VNYDFGAGIDPEFVAVGDFNRDGKPDLATANHGSRNVSVLMGNGNATFTTVAHYPAGPNPASVAVADFDRDGKPDLAVTNGVCVSILLNRR
jgi:hypothetical protein